MANAGTVTLDLDANSVKLLRELQKSSRATQRSARKMQSSMTRAFATIRRSVFTATSALAAFSSIRGLARVAADVDKIGKLSDRLGGSTEAFSELQFVAERSGLAFNTLTMGLQRMQRRVAEAAQDTGEAKQALKELGLNAAEVTKLSLDKQFEVIADALFRVKDAGDKTRLAMKLFDSEGVALLQTMKNGAAGIRSLRAEADNLGLSLSRDQVDAATRANDAWTNLSRRATALAQTLTLKLAPSLTYVVNQMNRALGGTLALDIQETQNRIDGLRQTLGRLSENTGSESNPTLRDFRQQLQEAEKHLDALLKRQGELIDASTMPEIEIPAVVDPKTVETARESARDIVKELLRQYETAEERVARLREELLPLREVDVERYNKIYKELGQSLNEGIEEIATGPILALKRNTKQATEEISEFAKQAARNMQDSFAEFLFDPFDEGLKGMLRGFADVIRRMLAELAATEIFGLLGGGGGFLGKLFGRATGGPVAAGTPYMVGERGPEVFVPGMSGAIIPNNALGGGSVFNFTTNISSDGGLDAPTLVPILEENNRKVKSEFLDELNRGKYQ